MDTTNTTVIILAVVVAFIIGGMLGMLMNRRQRTKRLQEKFGPEYERTVSEIGDARQESRREVSAAQPVPAHGGPPRNFLQSGIAMTHAYPQK